MFWRRNDNNSASTPEERTQELLSSYVDGELTPAKQAEVEALVARDPDARDVLDDLSLLTSALGSLGAEVRAPRSFAIPAPVAANGPSAVPLAMFQRVEFLFRASAAAAALLFVVVLVNDPTGETPVAAPMAAPSAAMAESGAGAADTFMLPQDAARTADGAPAPASAPASAPQPADGTPEAENGTMGALAMPAEDEPGGEEDATATSATAVEPGIEPAAAPDGPPADSMSALAGPTAAELAPETGTFLGPPSSDGVGGVAPALGTIAGLLTALSVILAWDRRTRERRHRRGD